MTKVKKSSILLTCLLLALLCGLLFYITVFELPFGSFFHFSQRNFSILSNFYFFSLITY